MNNTQKEIKETEIDCTTVHRKLDELNRVLLGLNAFGSLDLTDYRIILNNLKGSFNYAPIDDDEEL
ncbi:hypothetical protein KJ877_10655 [bacterium]|nr:hypothetical protein [bacterium]MBU1990279.1 hypothetical protein [bacterium]